MRDTSGYCVKKNSTISIKIGLMITKKLMNSRIFTSQQKVIETLRYLHDKTGVPVLVIGMGMANKKLSRYKHLYDRISEKVLFESFSSQDIKLIINELSEVEINDKAIEFIVSKINRFRQFVKLVSTIENLAEANI